MPAATDAVLDGSLDEATAAVVEDVARRLRARGERMTVPRRAVVVALAHSDGHLGADGVLAAVEDLDPSVHRASVYRTLAALSRAGVVQHVHEGSGGTVYHLVSEPHLHAQCQGCGDILDVRPDLLDGPAAALLAEHGFSLDAGHMALLGRCGRCA